MIPPKNPSLEIVGTILQEIFFQMLNNLRFYGRCQNLLLDSEDYDLKELVLQISEQQEPILVTKERFCQKKKHVHS